MPERYPFQDFPPALFSVSAAWVIAVSAMAGAIELTVMAWGPSSLARPIVRATTPALVIP